MSTEIKNMQTSREIKAEVLIHGIDSTPKELGDTVIKVKESDATGCTITVDRFSMILPTPIESVLYERNIASPPTVTAIVCAVILLMVDIYRYAREFFDFMYQPNMTDVILLVMASIGWGAFGFVLAKKKYNVAEFVFDPITKVAYPKGLGKIFYRSEQLKSLSLLQLLLHLVDRLKESKDEAFIPAMYSILDAIEHLREKEAMAVSPEDYHRIPETDQGKKNIFDPENIDEIETRVRKKMEELADATEEKK